MHSIFSSIILILILISCHNQQSHSQTGGTQFNKGIVVGAERTEVYFPWLENKSLAVVANQTSMIGSTHLVDSLIKVGYGMKQTYAPQHSKSNVEMQPADSSKNAGFEVKLVFGPEHGFRGHADAGEHVQDQIDHKTGLPIISLYGDHKKPTPEDLKGIDIVIFDIQDVGARFYTYISTMTYIMEACAENGITFIVLDRPNPNGDYIDGPILEKENRSFVGLHPVPIVHGLTVGEYALMVNGEGWLKNGITVDLKVVPVKGYDHTYRYSLPVEPSPNLPNDDAVCLYPSLCLFEGSVVSVGRGTDKPFQILGHPDFLIGSYAFIPKSLPGARFPKYEGIRCLGQNLSGFAQHVCKKERKLNLSWLINYYNFLKDKTDFFNTYFDTLAGNSKLRQQIINGLTEEEIRASWQEELTHFKTTRKKYLLYPDFE